MKWNLERCGIGATVHVLQYRTEILQLLSKVHGWIRLFLRRQDFLSAYLIDKGVLVLSRSNVPSFHHWSDLHRCLASSPSPRCYPAYPTSIPFEPTCSKHLEQKDCRDFLLSQVRKKSFTHTERRLHRIFRSLGVYLPAKNPCLLIKRFHL